MIRLIKEQMKTIIENDPAIHSPMEALLYPSLKVMIYFHYAHKLYLKKHYFLARKLSERAKRKTGIEIHPGATIGKGVFIDHGMGTVIGETAIVGDHVVLYHGVTLGGTGKEKGKRHPTIEENVMIGAGAKLLGNITVKKNSKIGANAVVLHDVEENSTAVGVPAKKIISSSTKKK